MTGVCAPNQYPPMLGDIDVLREHAKTDAGKKQLRDLLDLMTDLHRITADNLRTADVVICNLRAALGEYNA